MTINTKQSGDSGYVAFYKGKRVEVYGKSLLAARTTVAKHFKARKEYDINILIAEREDGSPVVHSTASL